VALVVVALVAAAWLLLSIRSLDSLEEGEAVLDRARRGPVSQAELRGARRAYADARRFAADGDALLGEASLLARAGRTAEADELVRRLLASEPENDQAWFLALLTARDPARAREARRRLTELNPWVGETLR
jgi:hypothetical protein